MLQHVAECCNLLHVLRLLHAAFLVIRTCCIPGEMPSYAPRISRDPRTYFVTRAILAGCSMLQCVAVCCSVLQCERSHPIPSAFLVIHTHILSHAHYSPVVVCCSVLQRVAVCCSVLQCKRCPPMLSIFLVIHTHILSHAHYSLVVSCCSVLQRVAVCCSVKDAILCSPYSSWFTHIFCHTRIACVEARYDPTITQQNCGARQKRTCFLICHISHFPRERDMITHSRNTEGDQTKRVFVCHTPHFCCVW